MEISVRREHLSNAPLSNVVTESGISTLTRPDAEKAYCPMETTPSGMTISES